MNQLVFRFSHNYGESSDLPDTCFLACDVHCAMSDLDGPDDLRWRWYCGPLETINVRNGEKTVDYDDDYQYSADTAEDMSRHLGHLFHDSAHPTGMERKNITVLQQLMFATIALHTLRCL